MGQTLKKGKLVHKADTKIIDALATFGDQCPNVKAFAMSTDTVDQISRDTANDHAMMYSEASAEMTILGKKIFADESIEYGTYLTLTAEDMEERGYEDAEPVYKTAKYYELKTDTGSYDEKWVDWVPGTSEYSMPDWHLDLDKAIRVLKGEQRERPDMSFMLFESTVIVEGESS